MCLPALIIWSTAVASAAGGGTAHPTVVDGPVEGMAFASLPGGSFEMGSPATDGSAESDEGPLRTVVLRPFQIMTTEVTQAMWESVMGADPAHFTGDPALPVEMVSWDDCRAFADSLDSRHDGYEYRLPTEAEWEYACRAGTTSPLFWGDIEADWMAGRYGWTGANSGGRTHPVATRLPNDWGIYDMVGNVSEWCQDRYHDNYDGLPLDGSAWVSGDGATRVLRGSWWSSTVPACRSAHRGDFEPGHRLDYAGFRLVRTPAAR